MNTTYTKLVTSYTNAVNSGKVLDVSELKTDGTGSRSVNVPKTGKGTKKWVEGLPIVSNNYATFAFAMQTLGPDFKPYADAYFAMHGADRIVPQVAVKQVAVVAPKSPARLGPVMTHFPITANMPAPVRLEQLKPVTKTAAKSPKVVQPGMIPVPGYPAVAAPVRASPMVQAPVRLVPMVQVPVRASPMVQPAPMLYNTGAFAHMPAAREAARLGQPIPIGIPRVPSPRVAVGQLAPLPIAGTNLFIPAVTMTTVPKVPSPVRVLTPGRTVRVPTPGRLLTPPKVVFPPM